MSAMGLVQGTRNGGGKDTPKAEQQKDVTVLDVYENAASAKIIASGWIDYSTSRAGTGSGRSSTCSGTEAQEVARRRIHSASKRTPAPVPPRGL